jgi:hypothetical protein
VKAFRRKQSPSSITTIHCRFPTKESFREPSLVLLSARNRRPWSHRHQCASYRETPLPYRHHRSWVSLQYGTYLCYLGCAELGLSQHRIFSTEYIAGVTNVVADFLSRYDDWCAKDSSDDSHKAFWNAFLDKFPQTKHCRLFRPSQELLSLLWQALLLNTVPAFDSPEVLALLKVTSSLASLRCPSQTRR